MLLFLYMPKNKGDPNSPKKKKKSKKLDIR